VPEPELRGGDVKLSCQWCEAEFERRQRQPFCSRSCAAYAVNARHPTRNRASIPWQDRFWQFVPEFARKEEGGCWRWLGSLDKKDGYGRIKVGGRDTGEIKAHRASWLIHGRKIPPGMLVLHTCANKWCVNPDHLELGTMREAMQRAHERHKFGYKSGAANPNTKLTDEQVEMIRRFHVRKVPQVELARAYGVAPVTINAIVRGRRRSTVLS
jgi:hypothetical protein